MNPIPKVFEQRRNPLLMGFFIALILFMAHAGLKYAIGTPNLLHSAALAIFFGAAFSLLTFFSNAGK